MTRFESSSPIEVEDRGWHPEGIRWDVSDMRTELGLEFDPWPRIREHLDYLRREIIA